MKLGRFEISTVKDFNWKPKRVKFVALGTFYFWFNLVFIVWSKQP